MIPKFSNEGMSVGSLARHLNILMILLIIGRQRGSSISNFLRNPAKLDMTSSEHKVDKTK